MRKIYFPVIIALCFPFKMQAAKTAGQILLDRDTLHVVFIIPLNFLTGKINYEKIQHRIKYIDSAGKHTLYPRQAEEISFYHKGEQIRMLSRGSVSQGVNPLLKRECLFLKLEVDGKLKLFKYYHTDHLPLVYDATSNLKSGMYPFVAERYFLQKDDDQITTTGCILFRSQMKTYLKDCPGLSQKIESREFRKKNLEEIVSYYNTNCPEVYRH